MSRFELVRVPAPHVEDAVLGEAVDPSLLVAVVDRVRVAVEGAGDRSLRLEEFEPHLEVGRHTVDHASAARRLSNRHSVE